jgi:hypothetical protein
MAEIERAGEGVSAGFQVSRKREPVNKCRFLTR